MDTSTLRARLAHARVATLGTTGDDGRPHLVPVCFVCLDDDRLVSAVDHKPKRSSALRRLDHVRARPALSLLAHHYEEDWSRLWWVRVDGRGTVVDEPGAELLDPLAAKYAPYADHWPDGPAIVVTVERWRGWSALP